MRRLLIGIVKGVFIGAILIGLFVIGNNLFVFMDSIIVPNSVDHDLDQILSGAHRPLYYIEQGGIRIWVIADPETGCEYLMPDGGKYLIPRLDAEMLIAGCGE